MTLNFKKCLLNILFFTSLIFIISTFNSICVASDFPKSEISEASSCENMKTKIIYFVHRTTDDNANKKCSGWKQVELNDLGIQQAKDLCNQTKNLNFDIIFTSDLIRALDTANFA